MLYTRPKCIRSDDNAKVACIQTFSLQAKPRPYPDVELMVTQSNDVEDDLFSWWRPSSAPESTHKSNEATTTTVPVFPFEWPDTVDQWQSSYEDLQQVMHDDAARKARTDSSNWYIVHEIGGENSRDFYLSIEIVSRRSKPSHSTLAHVRRQRLITNTFPSRAFLLLVAQTVLLRLFIATHMTVISLLAVISTRQDTSQKSSQLSP